MSSHLKTKKKKRFRVMSQKVKVFRSKDPLLSVLMWGVSHSVSTRFANLSTILFRVKSEASVGLLSCRSTNCRMWTIQPCWCRMTSKHSWNFAWTTTFSISEYYEWFTVFIFRFCYILPLLFVAKALYICCRTYGGWILKFPLRILTFSWR